MFLLAGRDVAGLGPGDHPAWTIYVAVANVSTRFRRPGDDDPAFDTHMGRISVLNDPGNAVFSILGPVPAD